MDMERKFQFLQMRILVENKAKVAETRTEVATATIWLMQIEMVIKVN